MDKEIEQLLQKLDIAMPSEHAHQHQSSKGRVFYIWGCAGLVVLLCSVLLWMVWPKPKKIIRYTEQPECCLVRAIAYSGRHHWSHNDLCRKHSDQLLSLQYETASCVRERGDLLSQYEKSLAALIAEHIIHPDKQRVAVLRRMIDQFLMADLLSAHNIVAAIQKLPAHEQDRELLYQGLGRHVVEYAQQYPNMVHLQQELLETLQAIESVSSVVELSRLVQKIQRAHQDEMACFFEKDIFENVPAIVLHAIQRIEKNFCPLPYPRACSQDERAAIDTLVIFSPDAPLWTYIDGSRKPYVGPKLLFIHDTTKAFSPPMRSTVRLIYAPEFSLFCKQ